LCIKTLQLPSEKLTVDKARTLRNKMFCDLVAAAVKRAIEKVCPLLLNRSLAKHNAGAEFEVRVCLDEMGGCPALLEQPSQSREAAAQADGLLRDAMMSRGASAQTTKPVVNTRKHVTPVRNCLPHRPLLAPVIASYLWGTSYLWGFFSPFVPNTHVLLTNVSILLRPW
jgi:hypothetical protein